MKKATLVITIVTLFGLVGNSYADVKTGLEKSATQMYSIKDLVTTKSTVDIIRTNNVVKTCEEESIRRGNGGFKGAPMEACSFHDRSSCTIITGWNTNNDILGHELHHCFAGAFH